jgi:hypothetical protein
LTGLDSIKETLEGLHAIQSACGPTCKIAGRLI